MRRRWLFVLGSIIVVLSLLAPQIVPSQRTRGMEEKNTELSYAKIKIVSNGKIIKMMNISMERAEEIKQSLEKIKRKIESSKDLAERMNLFEQALGILRENDILPPDFTLENIKEGIKRTAPYLSREFIFSSEGKSDYRGEVGSLQVATPFPQPGWQWGAPAFGMGSIFVIATVFGEFVPIGLEPTLIEGRNWTIPADLLRQFFPFWPTIGNGSIILSGAIYSAELLIGNAISLCFGMTFLPPIFKTFVGTFVYVGAPALPISLTIYLEMRPSGMHIVLFDATLLLALITVMFPFAPTVSQS